MERHLRTPRSECALLQVQLECAPRGSFHSDFLSVCLSIIVIYSWNVLALTRSYFLEGSGFGLWRFFLCYGVICRVMCVHPQDQDSKSLRSHRIKLLRARTDYSPPQHRGWLIRLQEKIQATPLKLNMLHGWMGFLSESFSCHGDYSAPSGMLLEARPTSKSEISVSNIVVLLENSLDYVSHDQLGNDEARSQQSHSDSCFRQFAICHLSRCWRPKVSSVICFPHARQPTQQLMAFHLILLLYSCSFVSENRLWKRDALLLMICCHSFPLKPGLRSKLRRPLGTLPPTKQSPRNHNSDLQRSLCQFIHFCA